MTPCQIAELIDLVTGTDMTYAEIANRIGVTKNAVIGKASRMGLRVPVGLRPTTLMGRLDALHAAFDVAIHAARLP